ncbi:MAG: OsmC family protein [Dissulfurispiraceae bacterium]|nr:OsmC family protein [Dissulfurispiraceae bacterium]
MPENNTMSTEENLDNYKKMSAPPLRTTLQWDKDLIFTGRTSEGYEIEFDANVQWGCRPTDALLLSLAGCMGIDMVSFLKKMRAEIKDFRMSLKADRNQEPPNYFKKVEISMDITGAGLDHKKVDRAISLSREKYCSVYKTMRSDMQMEITYKLSEPKEE